jgi:hypothetical protein
MGDGSYLYFVRHTEIHAPGRRRHCTLHFQQPVRFVAVYLRDQRRGLSARHYRVDDRSDSRCWCIYPASIGTRLIDGNWYVCDYVVVFLHDTRCRQMERIHGPNSVEPCRRILVQRCCPSLCLCRVIFGITAKASRPASVELTFRIRRVGRKWACCTSPRTKSRCKGLPVPVGPGRHDHWRPARISIIPYHSTAGSDRNCGHEFLRQGRNGPHPDISLIDLPRRRWPAATRARNRILPDILRFSWRRHFFPKPKNISPRPRIVDRMKAQNGPGWNLASRLARKWWS